MKLSRLLLVSAAPCLACAFALGCGSGGGYRGASTTSESSGTSSVSAGASGAGAGGMNAGAAGVGGAGGSAQGSEGGSAAAGSGGAAGMAGSGGVSTAGMGGIAGASGAAGLAGDAPAGNAGIGTGGLGATGGGGGAGAMSGAGTTGGFAGMAGSSGASGSAGSGGSAGTGGPLRTCGERCNSSADCRVFGFDQGFQCNAATHRCERFADPCRSATECIPDASFWIFTCRSDADCFFFSDDLCVDAGGVGRCARLAPSANGCMEPNADEVMMPRFGVSGSALVCANTSRTCEAGECVAGCRTNADCTPQRNGSVCDTQTRLCRCVSDQDCGGAGVSHCNTTTGSCECSDSRECEELPNANACVGGRCGCSGVSACNADRTFSGTTVVCE